MGTLLPTIVRQPASDATLALALDPVSSRMDPGNSRLEKTFLSAPRDFDAKAGWVLFNPRAGPFWGLLVPPRPVGSLSPGGGSYLGSSVPAHQVDNRPAGQKRDWLLVPLDFTLATRSLLSKNRVGFDYREDKHDAKTQAAVAANCLRIIMRYVNSATRPTWPLNRTMCEPPSNQAFEPPPTFGKSCP